MSDSDKKKLTNQTSFSHIEQIMKIIPTPQEEPIVIYPGPKSDMANMSKADLEIAQRLARLRRGSKDIPTEDDIKTKLAKLQDKPVDYYANEDRMQHFAPEQRTQTQQADALLSQIMDEVKLDATAPSSEQALAARLAALRGEDPAPPVGFTQPSSIPSIPGAGTGSVSYGFFGHESADIDMKEVDSLMKSSEKEVKDAQKSLDLLNQDATLSAAIASAVAKPKKEKKQKKNKKLKKKKAVVKNADLTSSDEKYSHSDSEYDKPKKKKSSTHHQAKEKEEIDRIVCMYTTKAKLDKDGSNSSSSDSSSSSEYISHSSSPISD